MSATGNSLLDATGNSLRGLVSGAGSERAVRYELTLLAVALPLGAVIAPSIAWYVAMIGVLLAPLAVEFVNTANEKLADRVTREHDAAIGRVKDLGSAAVFCMLCLCVLVWAGACAVRFI